VPQGRRDSRHEAESTGISKRSSQRRKANLRSSITSYKDNDFTRKLQNRLAHTLTYFVKFEVLTTPYFEGAILFKVDAMHMLVKTLCTCSCGTVLMMLVRMTRLPICVSDCKGNQK
jgi:hypothetical protein